jgi:hypothetical protein
VIRETVVRTGQAGDARFLSIIKDAVAEIARLKDLYPKGDAGSDGGAGDKAANAAFFNAMFEFFTGQDGGQRHRTPEDEIATLSGRVPRQALPESSETVQPQPGG